MLEVCVDTLAGVMAAMNGGARRVELCSSLSEGGLTPSAGLMHAAATLPIPCYAMIRPRCGVFHFSDAEAEIMLADIATARAAGLAGVVLGAQADDDALNLPLLCKLTRAAGPLGKTLHRVIDVVPAPLLALDQAVSLGFDRVLSSGSKPTAPEGTAMIKRMVTRAGGALSVMPGCGLTAENVADVMRQTGAYEAHAACNLPAAGDHAFSDFDPPGGRFETSETEVRRMVRQIPHT
ncbi:copper homeostasis protein CutC [Aliiroseovarius lamellibrachiae]|uniref:copper homeostasis protein CutC n=1 Tax=Aliiroseovarius lamellibrachiae TaxID=1924933 RepID=UPI001BE0587A|nr:copper homeostasis protein CutC [Aliiroseovarius lamellibrachiae]MBT2129613.1 copper homeostasis protein CutC [Aliiroseovarius lamellibrachiae]